MEPKKGTKGQRVYPNRPTLTNMTLVPECPPEKKRTLINNCSANVNPSPSPEQPKNRNSAFASASPLNRFDSGQRYQPPIVAAVPVNRKSAVTANSGGTGGEKARNSNALRLVAATIAEVSISPRQEAEDAVASDDESARFGAAQGTQQFVNVEIGFENSAAEGATAFASVGGLAPLTQSEMAEADQQCSSNPLDYQSTDLPRSTAQ